MSFHKLADLEVQNTDDSPLDACQPCTLSTVWRSGMAASTEQIQTGSPATLVSPEISDEHHAFNMLIKPMATTSHFCTGRFGLWVSLTKKIWSKFDFKYWP